MSDTPPFPRPAAPAQAPASGGIAPGMEAFSDEGPLHFMARALRARLQAVFPPARFDFQYLDGKLSKTQWDRLTRRTPTVCLGFAGVTPETNSDVFMGRAAFFVGVITRNPGGTEQRMLGDRAGPGLLSMIRAATIALNGFLIDPAETAWAASGSAEVGAVHALTAEFLADDMAAAGIDVTVPYEEALPCALDTPNHFDALQVAWTFEVAGGSGTWTDVIQQGTPT